MADQRVDQRARGVAGRGMHDQPRRLVDDDEVLVLEDDGQRHVLADERASPPAAARRPRCARRRRPCAPDRARASRRSRTSPASISAFRRVRDRASVRASAARLRKRSSRSPASSGADLEAQRGEVGCAHAPSRPRRRCARRGFGGERRGERAERGDDARPRRAAVPATCASSARRIAARCAGLGAAAAADDPRARVDREAGVDRHQFRRAGIMDMRAMPLRHAGVGLGDDDRVGRASRHAEHGDRGRRRRRRNWRRRRAARARTRRRTRRRPRARGPSWFARRCRSSRSRR